MGLASSKLWQEDLKVPRGARSPNTGKMKELVSHVPNLLVLKILVLLLQ
jgi:hypothetical protein